MNQPKWTTNRVSIMLKHIKDKKTLAEISILEGISIASIQTKLKAIAVDMYFNEQMPYEHVENITGIKKEEIVVPRNKRNPSVSGVSKDEGVPEVPGVPKVPGVPEVSGVPEVPIQISNNNPFTINSISTLLLSQITPCLLPRES